MGKEKGVLSPPLCCRRLLSGRSEEAHTLVAVVDHLNVAVKPGLAHLVISHLDQREDLEPRIVGDAHQVGHLDNLLDASVTLVDVIDFFHVILSTLDSPALRKDKRASFQALDIHIRPYTLKRRRGILLIRLMCLMVASQALRRFRWYFRTSRSDLTFALNDLM